MVAPSDMNDGRIGMIKQKLSETSLGTKVEEFSLPTVIHQMYSTSQVRLFASISLLQTCSSSKDVFEKVVNKKNLACKVEVAPAASTLPTVHDVLIFRPNIYYNCLS